MGVAHVNRRTRRFCKGDKRHHALEKLQDGATAGKIKEPLIPATELLPHCPNETVDALTAGQIRQGKDFRLSPFLSKTAAKYVKAISQEGDLIAIGEARLPFVY